MNSWTKLINMGFLVILMISVCFGGCDVVEDDG